MQTIYWFVLHGSCLWCLLRNLCLTQSHAGFMLCFLLEAYSFRFYLWICNAFWINFSIWCEVRIEIHSFLHTSNCSSTTCWKFFHHWIAFEPTMLVVYICLSLCLDSLFCSIDPFVYLCTNYSLDHYRLYNRLWNQHVSVFQLFSSFSKLFLLF